MKRVLILGASGMLGSMVSEVFSKNKEFELGFTLRNRKNKALEELSGSFFKFDATKNISNQLNTILKNGFIPDYIINCIGVIKPYCEGNNSKGVFEAIKINSLFPYELSNFCEQNLPNARVIQIATDCVYSGTRGEYTEGDYHDPLDVYGKTKSLGEVKKNNILNIRCSIIGPELKSNVSLLEWFLSQKEGSTVYGFEHHFWNGVTTLQFARFCENIIINDSFDKLRGLNHTIHYVVNEDVSKNQLLNIFKTYFKVSVLIEPTVSVGGVPINRTLRSNYYKLPAGKMENAIIELSEFIQCSVLYTMKKT